MELVAWTTQLLSMPQNYATWGAKKPGICPPHRPLSVSGCVWGCWQLCHDWACSPAEQSFLQGCAGVHSEKPSECRSDCWGLWAEHWQFLLRCMTTVLHFCFIFMKSFLVPWKNVTNQILFQISITSNFPPFTIDGPENGRCCLNLHSLLHS